jgi:hypothetical protein
MSLLEKAQECIRMSEELLYAGENAGSLACALEAAKYVQLIKLLREEVNLNERSHCHQTDQGS